jgi:hypothetical protein
MVIITTYPCKKKVKRMKNAEVQGELALTPYCRYSANKTTENTGQYMLKFKKCKVMESEPSANMPESDENTKYALFEAGLNRENKIEMGQAEARICVHCCSPPIQRW